jgi:tRNA(Arg) A34 adenosine deaminase TadA
MYEEKYMREAIELSKKCLVSGTGGPFGAVIVKDGKVVGRGSNRVTLDNDCTAHAEVTAIREACRNLHTFQLTGCDIYTSCEPCPMCLGAIYWARLETVYFAADRSDASAAGFDDSFIYNEIDLNWSERKVSALQKMRTEAVGVLQQWKNCTYRIDY